MTTKPKPKALTQKQAEIKGTSLIRGIDNSVARIRKETASIADATSQFKRVVLPALSNAAKKDKKDKKDKIPAKAVATGLDKAVAKAVAKAAKAAKKDKAVAKKDKPVAKKAKPVAKKAKPTAQSPSKAAQQAKPPVDGRPTIKEAIKEMIKEHGPISAADLWKKAVDKYGYWSRQSLYNALKDAKLFSKKDGVITLAPGPAKKDDDIDSFVDSVVSDKSVAHAT
jgi:hypothetical protein